MISSPSDKKQCFQSRTLAIVNVHFISAQDTVTLFTFLRLCMCLTEISLCILSRFLVSFFFN